MQLMQRSYIQYYVSNDNFGFFDKFAANELCSKFFFAKVTKKANKICANLGYLINLTGIIHEGNQKREKLRTRSIIIMTFLLDE